MKTNKLLNKILAFYLVFGLAALLAAMLLLYIFQKKHFASEIAEYITFFLTMMTGLILATRLIYKRFWNPFFRTVEQIERFNIKSDEMPQLPPTNVREFAQLNNALKKLAENSKNAYRIQKEFTENASHEMQTPLAVFQSKLDLLIQQPDLTHEQLAIIQSLYDTVARLTRMNKNLLLLAKIENQQFTQTQPINTADALMDAIDFFNEQIKEKNLHIETNFAQTPFLVEANKTLFEVLVNNLISNAIKHNITNGCIVAAYDGGRMSVSNTGIGQPLDETMLFRRFCRMTDKAQGSGLGLAIVQQICILYGWQIGYDFVDGMHRFAVRFK